MISIGSSMILLPSASAHTPAWSIPTYAYINVSPNPIGVGQKVLVIMWMDKTFSPETTLGNDYRFHNYMLTIKSPDGTSTTTTFAIVSDPTSAQDYSFTPTSAGTYTLNFTFPGQAFNEYDHPADDQLVNDTYLPSSASTTLVVQSSPILAYPTTPLPTQYWTRPIYGENFNWYSISSNWLGEGSPVESSVGSGDINAYDANTPISLTGAALNVFPGDAIGSLTSHIMWTKPLQAGGVVGGNNFETQGDTYFEGSAYIQRFTNPIIMDGLLYYQAPLSLYSESNMGGVQGQIISGTYCVDLQTGKQIWASNAIPAGELSFGYIYDMQQPNQKGVIPPILFATSDNVNNFYYGVPPIYWEAFDAYTGIWLFNVTNVPGSGTVPETMGPSGEHIRYIPTQGIDGNWYLAQWNSSNLWNWNVGGSGEPALNVNADLGAVDASAPSMYDWNISLPTTMPSSFQELEAFCGNMILCENGTLPELSTGESFAEVSSSTPYTYFAINLNASRGAVGSVLWWNTVNAPPGNVTVLLGPADPLTGVFTEGYMETLQWVGYSLYTGQKLWGPTAPMADLDYYGNPITPIIQAQLAYGNLYSMGYAGIIYCYNLKTGALEWTYGNGESGNSTSAVDTPFGDYPTFINAVGNGVVYTVTSEHTVNTPIYKGALARAINATNGQQIWTLSDYTGEFQAMSYAMADGYNTWFNGYDNQIYVVGRGPSATTVTAPQTAITEGNSVIIQGTVMDISAGTTQAEQAADFPNGVPCASDASMSQWMSYVYQQQPEQTNFTGVTVTLTAIDPNGNFITLGSATTDATGHFIYAWQTPQVSGKYTITATFAGTNGYWPSNAETGMFVQSAPPTPAPTASPVTGLATMSGLTIGIAAAAIAIIIAIAIVGLLILRKHA